MKNLLVLAMSLVALSARAELSVVTMSLTGTNGHLSKFDPSFTMTTRGLLVRSSDGANDCLLGSAVLEANNLSGLEFTTYLSGLNSSSDHYLLSCYTVNGAVTQVVVTKRSK